jgi:hypothetical protein
MEFIYPQLQNDSLGKKQDTFKNFSAAVPEFYSNLFEQMGSKESFNLKIQESESMDINFREEESIKMKLVKNLKGKF